MNVVDNARIQTIYREVNEGIALMNAEWDVPALELLCECGTAHCTERIELTHAEYERVRADPTTFALVPGHEVEAVEHVVRSAPGYVVVANHGRAARIAERTDPRAAAR
ncbi:MAG: hypothetical protein M3R12_05170 [Actinomycetota bacterium]|nr:hypothetical protein [Actinomycetota bacterium]